MRNDQPETVTASEIADFVFCSEAWRLSAIGEPSANRPEREAGTTHYEEKATAERVAGGSIAIGRILIAVALLALGILWALSDDAVTRLHPAARHRAGHGPAGQGRAQ